eukprot:TRINITY_DN102964_c0_g1_i1.p1 TRINITY_DN102964_c0_g1~~TRINITY_DN102964_c0_g1_i1.p1  ORF type:complete len:254 (-),score=18.53 TRINITY_DN102964_c0_g1_i1:372-1133(-)
MGLPRANAAFISVLLLVWAGLEPPFPAITMKARFLRRQCMPPQARMRSAMLFGSTQSKVPRHDATLARCLPEGPLLECSCRSWAYPLDHSACKELGLISTDSYMANTDLWAYSPRPGKQTPTSDQELAPGCLAEALHVASNPVVVFVERRYLQELIQLLEEKPSRQPFVLVTAGTDAPLTCDLQDRLAVLPGFRGCFATNLHTPRDNSKFHALPVGTNSANCRVCFALGSKGQAIACTVDARELWSAPAQTLH